VYADAQFVLVNIIKSSYLDSDESLSSFMPRKQMKFKMQCMRCFSTDDPVKLFDDDYEIYIWTLNMQKNGKRSKFNPFEEIPNVPPCDNRPIRSSINSADLILNPNVPI
jgi:hypothetical protein